MWERGSRKNGNNRLVNTRKKAPISRVALSVLSPKGFEINQIKCVRGRKL